MPQPQTGIGKSLKVRSIKLCNSILVKVMFMISLIHFHLYSIGSILEKMYRKAVGVPINFDIPSEWAYRGEGNDSVVLSIPKLRKILRIKKSVRPKSIFEWLVIWISDLLYWYLGKGIEDEVRDLKFYTTVMRRLLGTKYTSEANQVILTKKQVKILDNDLQKYRPGIIQLI